MAFDIAGPQVVAVQNVAFQDALQSFDTDSTSGDNLTVDVDYILPGESVPTTSAFPSLPAAGSKVKLHIEWTPEVLLDPAPPPLSAGNLQTPELQFFLTGGGGGTPKFPDVQFQFPVSLCA